MKSAVFDKNRAICLIAGNAIGTGIFTTTGFALRDLESPWIVLAIWILGGIYSLLGVYSYSILHKRFPGSGGEYHFLSKGINHGLGITAGFITILMGFTAPLAATSYACAIYFQRALPLDLNTNGLSMFVFTFIFLLHFKSQDRGMKWHDGFIYLKLALFAILILISFSVADWHWPSSSIIFNLHSFSKSFFWIAYAYSGWNAVYYVANEVSKDSKAVNKASYMGSLLVVLLYVFLNIPLLFGTNPTKIKGAADVVAVFFETTTGVTVERAISAIIALGLLSTISTFLVIVPRIYSRMSEDKVLPQFFYFPAGTNPRKVFIFQYLLTLVILFAIEFESILKMAGFILTTCSLLTVLSLYNFKNNPPLTFYQTLGTLSYIILTSILIIYGGPWFI